MIILYQSMIRCFIYVTPFCITCIPLLIISFFLLGLHLILFFCLLTYSRLLVNAASFHNSCNSYSAIIPNLRSKSAVSFNGIIVKKQYPLSINKPTENVSTSLHKRLLSSTSSKQSTSSQTGISKANATKLATGNSSNNNGSNASTKYFTTKTHQDNPPTTCVDTELSQLRSEIANLSYLIKQTASHQVETQSLARRAEARAYIIENKLMDIQSHVVKIPALENLAQNLRQYLNDNSPSYINDAIRKVNESGVSFLTSKYTAWVLFGSIFVFWQYRLTMYQRTSEEVANVAAMTLKQDSLRETIQETLTTVANSPETLASLSVLFQKLISEERTEQHLINLIVRALNSEGVRDAAIYLLDVCFQNPDLQTRAGEFLKVAANATVLDEGVQKNAGVGIQQALKSAVLPGWAKKAIENNGHNNGSSSGSNGNNNGSDGGDVSEKNGRADTFNESERNESTANASS